MVLKVLKVYRLRCFKKTEILSCGLYADNKTILLYTYKKEDSKKEKKDNVIIIVGINFILKSN